MCAKWNVLGSKRQIRLGHDVGSFPDGSPHAVLEVSQHLFPFRRYPDPNTMNLSDAAQEIGVDLRDQDIGSFFNEE